MTKRKFGFLRLINYLRESDLDDYDLFITVDKKGYVHGLIVFKIDSAKMGKQLDQFYILKKEEKDV